MMNLQLKRLRKQAGFKTQGDLAAALGIPERRYASWERGEVAMSLEQAIMVSEVLGCTLDELAGRDWPKNTTKKPKEDKQRNSLNQCYSSMNDAGRSMLLSVAKSLKNDPENQITHHLIDMETGEELWSDEDAQ